jgi:dolichyl-phosphate-mannose-protein mannosyltransferase
LLRHWRWRWSNCGRRDGAWLALLPLAGSLAFFVYFFPILRAAPLDGEDGLPAMGWLPGWR